MTPYAQKPPTVPISNYLANLSDDILARAAKVRVVAFDVDGTLTDGRLTYSNAGCETKTFDVHDGFGLKRLQAYGIHVAFITARHSEALMLRAKELNITHVYQGQGDKRSCLSALLNTLQLTPEQVAFVGDDLVDLPALHIAGLAIAVANAHPWVAEQAHWQTRQAGGHGAAREVCDLILRAQGHDAAERAHWQ